MRALLGLLLLLGACAAPRAATPPAGDTVRIETPLMTGWRFFDGDAAAQAAAPGFDDRGWRTVSLPHTWNALGEYGLERTGKTRNRQGIGWYRLTIDGAALPARSRHWLQFDAVGNVADVWVNGVHVGRHAGAFSRFRFDVTGALRRDGVNRIAVRADNSMPAPGSTTQDVIPLKGDFFIHGGLYRPVALISAGETHIDLSDHGGPGVYIDATPRGDAADVRVRTRLTVGGEASDLRVMIVLKDAGGNPVAGGLTIPARGAREVEARYTLAGPRLWDGRRDPYLYRAEVLLFDGQRRLDRVVQRFGIRSIRFDPDLGFFLNGRHLPLHGVSRHQDWLDRGWALTREDHARDMALIAEMGANTIRMAHYQHAGDWFDLSDEAGMMVWAEAPYVNKPAFGDGPATPELIANAREQMIELIRQNYNHPSVITWGTGNEVDIERSFGSIKADGRPLLDELRRVATAEDPGRPTVLADCCEATPARKPADLPILTGHADLMGYNRYYGWYYGAVDDLGPHLDLLHARYPRTPISVSEYGAGAALSQHSDNPEGGPIDTGGRWHPEEYQSWVHERSWPQLAARRYVWASWIWNMFDFSSVIRKEGDATDINDKGLVTYDRAVRKDSFFYYMAQWRDDVAVLHIAGRRYAARAYPVTDIRVYSNLASVELVLNGALAGRAACPGRVCVFREVALRPGGNRVEVRGSWNGAPVSDSLVWNAPDARDGLSINAGDLAGFVRADGSRVGSDNWFTGGTASRIGGRDAERLAGADRRLLTGRRQGRFGYSIPLPEGRWRVTLRFVGTGAPQRFDVTAEGRTVLRGVGPNAPFRAGEAGFEVAVRDGRLDLGFGPDATLSAIEVRPIAARASRR